MQEFPVYFANLFFYSYILNTQIGFLRAEKQASKLLLGLAQNILNIYIFSQIISVP